MIEFILIAAGVGLAGLIVYRIFFVHETVAQVESDIMTGLKGAETKVEEKLATFVETETKVAKEIEAEVVEVVEEVKVATKKLKAKTKAIEEAAEAKVKKIEAALKKAKGNG
jgi:hypothetical protein